MLAFKTRTLRDWLDHALKYERDPRRVRQECLDAVTGDATLLMELLGLDEAAIWERFAAAAKRHGDALRAGGDQIATVETTKPGVSPPAPVRLPLTSVTSHLRRTSPPKRFKPPVPRELERRVMGETARMMTMVIDGLDLRKWTLGRVKSESRIRGHEARVIERIARDYAHHPLDTAEVGELMSDHQLAQIIEECRT